MTETGQDFEMWEGESKILDVAEVDDTDISSQEITWILFDEDPDDAEVTKTTGGGGIDIDNGTAGEFEIELDPADTEGVTGRFQHECRIDDGGGTESVLFVGEAIINQSGTA
jgi:hypothetical protein